LAPSCCDNGGNFHRQSLIHQKQLTDNIYYRNVNNNSGIFNYIIGEAEEQDWKEALLAYYGLLTAAEPLTREALVARIEGLLTQLFGVSAAFEIGDALARLKRLNLLDENRRLPVCAAASGRACATRRGLEGAFTYALARDDFSSNRHPALSFC